MAEAKASSQGGREISLTTNLFPVGISNKTIYLYKIWMEEVDKPLSVADKRAIFEIMRLNESIFSGIYPVLDTNVSSRTSSRQNQTFNTLYTARFLRIFGTLRLHVNYKGHDHKITIKEDESCPEMNMKELNKYFDGFATSLPKHHIKVIETIIHHCLQSEFLLINKLFFPNVPMNQPNYKNLYFVQDGYHFEIVLGEKGIFLSVNFEFKSLYPKMSLLEFIQNYLKGDFILTMSESEILRLNEELNLLKVYKEDEDDIYTIICVLESNALELETKEKNSIQKYNDTFSKKYGYDLNFPQLPLLKLRQDSTNNVKVMPMEAFRICPFQMKYLQNYERTSEWYDSADRGADQALQEIRSRIFQIENLCEPAKQEFGLTICCENHSLKGRILDPPTLIFKDQREVVPQDGKYPLDDLQFFKASNLTSWAVISFCEPEIDENIQEFSNKLMERGVKFGMQFSPPLGIFHSENNIEALNESITICRDKYPDLQIILLVLSEDHSSQFLKEAHLHDYDCTSFLRIKGSTIIAGIPEVVEIYCDSMNQNLGGVKFVYKETSKPEILDKNILFAIGRVLFKSGCHDKSVVGINVNEHKNIFHQRITYYSRQKKTHHILSLQHLMESFLEEYHELNEVYPDCILFFRMEFEFRNDIFREEIEQIRDACQEVCKDEVKITYVMIERNIRINLYPEGTDKSNERVPPGIIVNQDVVGNGAYLQTVSHQTFKIASPIKFKVVFDENNFSLDSLPELTHYLSYISNTGSTSRNIFESPFPSLYDYFDF